MGVARTRKSTPTHEQIRGAVDRAHDVVKASEVARAKFRRRQTIPRRYELPEVLARCSAAARPLRSYIGRCLYHDISSEDELAMKAAIKDLQYERRQLRKMIDA